LIIWRLSDPRFARDLSGTGNRLVGARWNSPGRGVVYASETLSLAVLEVLAHLPPPLRARLPRRAVARVELPGGLPIQEVASFPRRLRGEELLRWCRDVGDRWLAEAKFPLLRAPSVIVPEDRNVMINPLHPAAQDMRIAAIRTFQFDQRLASK
jgi:RES domain-containing protein